jgi:hypothetical protein
MRLWLNNAQSFKDAVLALRHCTSEYIIIKNKKVADPELVNIRRELLVSALFRYRRVKADVLREIANRIFTPDQTKILDAAMRTGDAAYSRARLAIKIGA